MTALLVLGAGLAALACLARARASTSSSAPASVPAARPGAGLGSGRVAAWWAGVLADGGIEG
ncbi:MAG TPA: hypothetical protein VF228_01590, partial [Iamia sp.]